jgi:hypothetical protein
MLKIDFEFDSKHGVYRDALYFPVDHTHTTEEIAAMKQARFDAWLQHVDNSPAPQETVELDGVTYIKSVGENGVLVLTPADVGDDNG